LFFAAVPTFLVVGSLEAVLGDFPSAVWWAPRIQGVEELQQRRTIDSSGSSLLSGSRSSLCNFRFGLGLSISSKN
jgi:hypothetical protein